MRLFLITIFLFVTGAHAKTVLLTGYWAPTNEMLREFSTDPLLNPGGWKGENWRGLGYDVYAYFPTFADANDTIGHGHFRVDFAAAYNDFFRVTTALKPSVILSFGRGAGPWEIETNFPDHFEEMFAANRIPSAVGARAEFPVPASLTRARALHASLPFSAISAAVNSSIPGLAWIDSRSDAGDYLCGFTGYLGAWYKSQNPEVTATGFIHVNTDLATARAALHLTLETVLKNQ